MCPRIPAKLDSAQVTFHPNCIYHKTWPLQFFCARTKQDAIDDRLEVLQARLLSYKRGYSL
jgi:hypothetical protein